MMSSSQVQHDSNTLFSKIYCQQEFSFCFVTSRFLSMIIDRRLLFFDTPATYTQPALSASISTNHVYITQTYTFDVMFLFFYQH